MAMMVEHDDAVVQAVDDEIARDRHQAEQAVAIEAPHAGDAGHGEPDRA